MCVIEALEWVRLPRETRTVLTINTEKGSELPGGQLRVVFRYANIQ